jgi:voltage-gated potassium channel
VLLFSVLLYGSTGFLYFELEANPQLTWLDGIWYAVVTVTTVGYGDLSPLTVGGRFLVAMPLMFLGIGLVAYVLSLAASALVQAKSKEIHGMNRHTLKKHLVFFNFPGLDKMHRVLDELEGDSRLGESLPKVLIDDHLLELPPELIKRNVAFVRGNPTRDETLERASLDDAAFALVMTSRQSAEYSDSRNVAIALAIEGRAPHVFSVVECDDFATHELLKKAGSDAIVCTSRFDAHFLAHELLSPGTQEVVDQLTSNLRGQQICLTRYEGKKTISFAQLGEACQKHGHMAIGIRSGGTTRFNPGSDAEVRRGDSVISIGEESIDALGT